MTFRPLVIALLALTLSSTLSLADTSPDAEFAAACQLLDAGDYAAARDALAALIAADHLAPEVFFQLGNAYFRLGETGPAALSYHRALYLDPTHQESSQNLAVVKKRSGSISNDGSKRPEILRKLSDPLLARALASGIGLAAIGFAMMILSRQRRLRGTALASIVAGVAITGASAWAAYSRDASRPSPAAAIVIATGTLARTAPAESASQVSPLPPGSEIDLIARRGTWAYVDLPDGLRGWLPATSIEPLWPFAPAGQDS